MADSVIIIGAGIAGLAAGCYARMNGYRTTIFELHDLPGGLCTAWDRHGYTFDGCLHYLFGSAPGQPFYRLWEELGAVQGRKMIQHDELLRVAAPDGRTLIVHADPERLDAHLRALSPEDAGRAAELAAGVRQFMAFDMTLLQETPRALLGPRDWLALGQQVMPYMVPLAKWGMTSAREYAARFHDPFLRRAVPQMFAWEEIPMMVGLSLLAYMHQGNAAFPAGGSLAFARAIERRYLALGGDLRYNAQVEKILVEDDRAVGVRLYNDEEHRADAVISAADGRGTLFDLLDGRYVNRELQQRYDGHLPLRSQLQVSLGVARDLSGDPPWTIHLLDEPLVIAGEPQHAISVNHYSYDPSMAPAGKSSMVVMIPTDFGYWQRIYGRRLYRTEQEQVLETVLAFLETRYPGLRAQVEADDVATPLSYERYTGNWQGSTCGWLLTDDTMMLMINGMDKTLPGLRNFYLAGQWVEPGGSVPVVAMSGRNAVQLLCHDDGRPFVATVPEPEATAVGV